MTSLPKLLACATAIAASLALPGPAQAQISGFNNGAGYSAVGAATFTAPETLQLTNDFFQASSSFFTTKQSITAFTASFTYQLVSFPNDPQKLSPADGVTFAIQGQGPVVIGGSGSDLGFAGIHPGAAVFLNVYSLHNAPSTGLVRSGVNGGSPVTYTSTLPVDLLDEQPVDVSLTYNGSTLTETLTQGADTFTQSYSLNLASLVGSQGFVGFTGGTGGGASTQTITNFVYTPQRPTATPEPTPLAALAIPTLLLGALIWRRLRAVRG